MYVGSAPPKLRQKGGAGAFEIQEVVSAGQTSHSDRSCLRNGHAGLPAQSGHAKKENPPPCPSRSPSCSRTTTSCRKASTICRQARASKLSPETSWAWSKTVRLSFTITANKEERRQAAYGFHSRLYSGRQGPIHRQIRRIHHPARRADRPSAYLRDSRVPSSRIYTIFSPKGRASRSR